MKSSIDKPQGKDAPKENIIPSNIPKNIGELSEDVLSDISNQDFLNIQRENRLRYITNPNTEASKIIEGGIVSFRFGFNGKINQDLFLKTTAGQVLPPSVEEVMIGGLKFKRDGLYGEFFTETGSRLIIRDKTQIVISKIRAQESINNTELVLQKESSSFGEHADIAFEAKRRGIDPDFAILAFSEKLKITNDSQKSGVLENMLTDFGRTKGIYGMNEIKNEKGIYRSSLALSILSANNQDWKEKGKKYGILDSEIKNYESEGMNNMSLKESDIDNGENLMGEALWNYKPFKDKIQSVCEHLGINPDDLKVVMIKESKINPKIVNGTSNATGLIQFMPKTARGLGTTVGHLRGMSGVDQLTYVQKYFEPYRGKLGSVEDLYLATFYPAALGRDDSFIIGSEGQSVSPELIASQNYGIAPGKSVITVGDFKEYVNRRA
ncbi:transglycosylase SLT domain-containing protein [Candidatus Gracilibacteria bacterium]|nr:transglycosylase SLT domain-containing protein [Candidatus Gracilibacteria bacterium]